MSTAGNITISALTGKGRLAQTVAELVQTANENGGKVNISMILVKIPG
ncbi:MAG: hypothetical protein OXE42_00805 [Gammaproteobacteria bacterium]|nr:hypothetical protein [Gammaproteobacteria bacterium]